MTNVTVLRTDRDEAKEQVIHILKEFLKDAENGDIVAVAIAAITPDNKTQTAASAGNLPTLIGCVERLKFRMLKEHDEL